MSSTSPGPLLIKRAFKSVRIQEHKAACAFLSIAGFADVRVLASIRILPDDFPDCAAKLTRYLFEGLRDDRNHASIRPDQRHQNARRAEAGEGFPVVLCHGFPELWYSWRHQMSASPTPVFARSRPTSGAMARPTRRARSRRTRSAARRRYRRDARRSGNRQMRHRRPRLGRAGRVERRTDVAGTHRARDRHQHAVYPAPADQADRAMRAMSAGGFHYILYFQTGRGGGGTRT